jgi:hypothetical protein
MKKFKLIFAALTMSFLFIGIGISANAHGHSKQKANSAIEAPAQMKIEHKETYKIDDAEFTAWTVSKPSFPGLTYVASAGILAALIVAITSLFKPDKIQGTVCAIALIVGVTAFIFGQTEAAVAGITYAKIAPVAFKVNKEGVDKESDEYKFLEGLEKRIKIEGGATHEEITKAIETAVTEGMKEVKTLDAAAITKLLDEKTGAMAIMLKQGQELTELKGKLGSVNILKSWKNNIEKFWNDENVQKRISETYKNGSGFTKVFGGEDEFVNKVVGNVTTSSVSTDSGGNAMLDLVSADDLVGLNLRDPFIENYATVTRTSKPVYTYADYKPKDGDAGFTAEAAAKSQVDLQVVVKTIAPKKATAYEIMSEEALTDIPRLQSESQNLLLRKVLLKRQYGILFGDTTGDTPNGVINQANAFDGASWTGDKVTDVNLYDVIVAIANQIYNTHNYTDEQHYYPNLAVLNPSTIAALKLKKNEFGMYLFPAFQLVGAKGNTINIDGITVLPQRDIPAAKILVGDFTKLRIINYVDYSNKMGWINDQFIKNLFTMLGESRFYTVIKSLDKAAFIYDDIADVVDGIKSV